MHHVPRGGRDHRPTAMWLGAILASIAAGGALTPRTATAIAPDGHALYRQHCARCHGPQGGGTAEAPEPLAGDLSVNQLAAVIAETMPEDDPTLVAGDDALAVAAHIHATFYSAVARDRNRPARVDLARLTVRQHRAVLADVVGSFRGRAPAVDQRRGLRGEYFHDRGFERRGLVFERIDPRIDMQFGVEGPDPERFEPNRFAIRWSGAIVPPETGTYEFVVRTEHSARLALNRAWYEPPFIDAWVKSGDETEYRGSLFLLGGRAYPLRLEFSKANQGVNNRKHEPLTNASIALLWKPPHGVLEPVPERCLLPVDAPEVFVAATPFPPDDTSTGYERGTNVSREWFSASTAAAGETAAYLRDHVEHLARVKRDAPDRAAALRRFAATFAERAFRRPLQDEVRASLIDHPFDTAPDPDTALVRATLGVLGSPRFLFHEPGTADDGYATAARLAFGCWDSIPDEPLLKAAADGRLASREEVRRQAERMVGDARTKSKLRDVLFTWLKLAPAPELAKDPDHHPDFTGAVAADLRTSLDLFLEDVAWNGSGDWRLLFTEPTVHLNQRLAALYGIEAGRVPFRSADDFRPLPLDDGLRAGLLSHPYLMSVLAHPGETSPIHRGVFVARTLLGNVLKPPQEAITPLAPDQHPGLTTRERVTLQTSPVACRTCHTTINPLGFALEGFDAVGRHRTTERVADGERPIDVSGTYQPREGEPVSFAGARELGAFLAESDDASEAFVQALFHAVVKQPLRAWGPDALARLTGGFRDSGHDIRRLLVDIMVEAAFPPQVASARDTATHGTGEAP